MDIDWCTLDDVDEVTGTVVVIDVLRAFTTAAVGLAAGVTRWELVGTVDEAHQRRALDPATILVGEVDSHIAPGFDHGNSPAMLARAHHQQGLDGTWIVHRSTAGTQGVVRASSASRILAASFAVAGATARALVADSSVAMCVTGIVGRRDGDEDRACGEYLAALLERGPDVDPAPFVRRVATSIAAEFFHHGHDDQPPEDVTYAQVVDRFDFAMEVQRHDDRFLLAKLAAT